MPEFPDFDQIARGIDRIVAEYARTTLDLPDPVPVIIEQLRQLWNARGAADIAKLEILLPNLTTVQAGAMKVIDAELRTLDR